MKRQAMLRKLWQLAQIQRKAANGKQPRSSAATEEHEQSG